MAMATYFVLAMAFVGLPLVMSTPTPSVLTCHGITCMEGTRRFHCESARKVCCAGPSTDSYQVYEMKAGFSCCEGAGRLYDEYAEICVNGMIRARGPGEKSCGKGGAYNETTQVCCGEEVYDKVPDGECCLNEYLRDPNESCCEGVKYLESEQVCCERREILPDYKRLQLYDIPYGQCCLDTPYDPLQKSCEINEDGNYQLYDKAGNTIETCGYGNPQLYDTTTHGCCISATPKVYDLHSQICSRGLIYNKTDPNQNDVCFELNRRGIAVRATPYTKDEKTLCVDGKVTILGPLERKCGSHVQNISTDLCCGNKFYRGAKASGANVVCCDSGTNYYNPDREICCANEVSAKMSRNSGAMCCHKEPYNPDTSRCESGVVNRDNCNVTLEKIQSIKNKVYIYFGTVKSSRDKGRGRRRYREWEIEKMQVFKVKRGRVTLVPMKGKGKAMLKSNTGDCPEHLEVDSQYIFVTNTPVKRGKIVIQGGKAQGLVVPLEDVEKIGVLFKGLVQDHS